MKTADVAQENESAFMRVARGKHHSLALKHDGTVIAWGNNSYGQANVPSDLKNVVVIDVGEWHSLALKSDGTVVVWGRHAKSILAPPKNLSNVAAVATDGNCIMALCSDGAVVGWGTYDDGRKVPLNPLLGENSARLPADSDFPEISFSE